VGGGAFKAAGRRADAWTMTADITVGDYLPRIRSGLTPGTISAWGRALTLIESSWSERPLRDIVPSDVAELARTARDTAVRRRHHGGQSSAEHAVAAARHLFGAALKDGLVERNVALSVPKPARGQSERHALSRTQTAELLTVATRHHERTMWMLRWLLETGSRREGLLNLEPGAVRAATRTVMVTEKGRKTRVLPLSASLAAELARPTSTLYDWSRHRLEDDWDVLRAITGWGAELGVSCHWMRHTAVTRMERASSFVVAATWAGHSMSSTVTSTYVRVGLAEVACGWSSMTGELHPMHDCEDERDCYVVEHRPELLTPPAENGGNLRLLRGTA
jgi:integrase